jgi:hypothetical protein
MLDEGFIDDFEKGDVVAIFLEQRQPGHGSIEGVVDVAAWSMARRSWHD